MQTSKQAVSAGASFAVSVAAVPAALNGLVAHPPAAGHDGAVAAALDAHVVREVPPARPLVTRILRRSARKSYTIVSGDTLSGIAQDRCGDAGKWPSVWRQNRAEISDPDLIYPGTELHFTCDGTVIAQSAPAVAQVPAPVHRDRFDGKHGNCGDGDGDGMDADCAVIFPQQAAPAAQARHRSYHAAVTDVSGTVGGGSYGNVSPSSYSGMQQCIITRESGGDSQVMNASGHYGLYQFSASTWAASGGNPADFGHASVAEQNQVFQNAVAARGYSDWTPYDGC